MTPELQRYYEDRLLMFSEKAWKDLVEDVKEMEKATNDLNAVQDEKTLHFRRGELSIMRWILSLEDVTSDSYEQLKAEDK